MELLWGESERDERECLKVTASCAVQSMTASPRHFR
jgi:hypothetical protein